MRFYVTSLASIAYACTIIFVFSIIITQQTSALDYVSHHVQHNALDFWTPERMANAITPPWATRNVPLSLQRGLNEREERFCPSSDSQIYKIRADTSEYPLHTIGKVFYTSGNKEYVCSGSIAEGRKHVWTAGHCVYDHENGNGFVTNFVFIPQYINGSRPYGTFHAWRLHTTTGWQDSAAYSFDWALAEFESEFPESLGSFSLITDISDPANTLYNAYGYPEQGQFNGEFLYRCTSTGCERDPEQQDPPTVGVTCDAQQGTSGGPLLVLDTSNSDNSTITVNAAKYKIAGIISYSYGTDGTIYSPFFTESTRTFYNRVASESMSSSAAPSRIGNSLLFTHSCVLLVLAVLFLALLY